MIRSIDVDSPDWAPIIMAGAIIAFALWVMADAAKPKEVPQSSIPPAVYVVETIP